METPEGAAPPAVATAEPEAPPAVAEAELPEDAGVRRCATCGTEFGVNLRGDPGRGIPPVPAGTGLACPVCRTPC